MSPRLLSVLLCLLGLCLLSNRGQAQVAAFTWSGNGTSGNVTDGTNWGGTAPTGVGGFENLIFDASGPQTNVIFPTFNGASLTFGSSRPAYTFSGTGVTPVLTLSAASGVSVAAGATVTFDNSLGLNLAAGLLTGDDHTFNIAAATTLQINGVITGTGHFSKTGTGTLVLTGANTFNYNGGLGFLNSSSIHAGTVLLDGGAINHGTSGDIWVGENNGDDGTLTITNGGTASGYYGVLGSVSGSTGTATISGNTSSWSVSNGMSVGSGGTGTLTLANGGTVNIVSGTGTLNVGATSGSTGTLNIGAAAVGAAAAGGIVNAATITSANGATGTLQFNTTATSGTPYYLTKDGTSGGAAVAVTGTTKVINTGGYNVLTGTNTYTGGTMVNGGTLAVTGAGSISHVAADTFVGYNNGDSADLLISGGADVADKQGQIGFASGSNGVVTVTGAGSTWNHSLYLYVGLAGLGTLDLSSGASVSSPNTSIGNNTGGDGEVFVDGAGTSLTNTDTLYVGSAGIGYLDITNGGTVTDVTGSVGNNAGGGGGSVYMDTGGVWNNTGSLLIGNATTGNLDIYGGGTVTALNAIIGSTSGVFGSVYIANAGSTFTTTSGNLIVGAGGTGTLDISSGAQVQVADLVGIGNSTGSTGTVTLSGVGSALTVANGVLAGNNGLGEVYLNDGAVLSIGGGTGTLTLGASSGSGSLYFGTYNVEGGTDAGFLNAATITTGSGFGKVYFESTNSTKASPFYLTKDGTSGGGAVAITGPTQVENVYGYTVLTGANTYTGGTTITGGTLVAGVTGALGTGAISIDGGILLIGSGVVLNNSLSFVTGGTLGGSGTFGSAFTAGPGINLAPGNSPGTLSFTNGLTLAGGGTLDFEVQLANGAAGTGYDLLSISGAPLDITASSGSPFTLKLISLNASGTAGAVSDFSSGSPYAWTIATSSAGITGFAANAFTIDTTGFTNSLGIGSFSLSQSGNTLVLNFSPVPEPSTYALMATGLATVYLAKRRKKRVAP